MNVHHATITDLVRTYRAAGTALRGIRARDGRTAATWNAIDRHEHAQDTALAELVRRTGWRTLVGNLVEEDKLAVRCAERRAAAIPYPDLDARLRAARATIRRHLEREVVAEHAGATSTPDDDIEAIIAATLAEEIPARPALHLVADAASPDLARPGDQVAVTETDGHITAGQLTHIDGTAVEVDTILSTGRVLIERDGIAGILVLDRPTA